MLALLLLVACAPSRNPQAYPGPPRSLSEIAVASGTERQEGRPRSRVRIVSVDGEDWHGGRVHLLPGTHELRVRYGTAEPAAWKLLPRFVARLAWGDEAYRRAYGDRTLVVYLDPGFTYALQMMPDPIRYFVTRYPTRTAPDPLPFVPAWGLAWPCGLDPARDPARLECRPADPSSAYPSLGRR